MNQLPFSSINYGLDTTPEGRMAIDALLNASISGLGKNHRTSIFPCGIFQIKDGVNKKPNDPNYDLKRKALYSTVRRFYPNYMNGNWSVQVAGIQKDREIKRRVISELKPEMKKTLISIFKEHPTWAERMNLKVDKYDSLIVTDDETPTEIASTMGCVDGSEVITYKLNGNLYVESFERFWKRVCIETAFEIKRQSNKNLNLYIDLENVQIYDSGKNKFVDCKRIIRNNQREWNKVYLSSGRILDCTDDHPLPTERGRVYARDLIANSDKLTIVNKQYTENKYKLKNDIAWLYGVILCDGCITNQISATFDFKTEKDITNTVSEVMNKLGLDTKIKEWHRGKKGDYYEVRGYEFDKDPTQYNKRNFISLFEGIAKNHRHIPNMIFESDYTTRLNFLAGMIDADGYCHIKKNHIELGSINKELAIQQMLLSLSLGFKTHLYENHYDSKDISKIRYQVCIYPTKELIDVLRSGKKKEIGNTFIFGNKIENETESVLVTKIESYKKMKYSYDVTTESDHFDVSGIWSHNCRTYNGFDINFTEKYFFSLLKKIATTKQLPKNYLFSAMQKDGRGNIAPSTIIMPTLAMKARLEVEKDSKLDIVDIFMKKLSEAIDDTKDFLIERYEHICSQKPESARFMYENNVMKGYEPEYGISSALKHGTLAIGQLGLAETLQILIGKNHLTDEGMKIAIAIESLFKTKCDMFKKEYSLNFGVYYTPAENLCYTAMKKFKKAYGEHPYIKELIKKKVIRDYFTNSIHVPVWEEVDPYTKIDIETQLTGFSNAGCITYVELDGKIIDNIDAVEQILDYAITKDCPYIAFNIPADCCLDCGFIGDFQEKHTCTKCGSKHVLEPARVTGYLTGDWRYAFNHGKQDEKKDRVKHTKYMNNIHCNCGE